MIIARMIRCDGREVLEDVLNDVLLGVFERMFERMFEGVLNDVQQLAYLCYESQCIRHGGTFPLLPRRQILRPEIHRSDVCPARQRLQFLKFDA